MAVSTEDKLSAGQCGGGERITSCHLRFLALERLGMSKPFDG
jgi:hypothetical protein